MPRLSEMPAPGALTGLELLPALQGGGVDGNVGLPLLLSNPAFGGNVLALRVPMAADMSGATEADPGAAGVRWNNADPELATEIYISDADGNAGDLAAFFASLAVGGFIYVQGSADSAARDNLQRWQVTAVDAEAGYTKLAVALQASAGVFDDDDALELTIQQPAPTPGVDRNVVTALSSASGLVTVDCSLGDFFTLTPTEVITGWSFTNVPTGCCLSILATQGGTPYAIAVPAATWPGGTVGAFSTAAGKVDELSLLTMDAGGTWHAMLAKDRS
ncbi:MAG: hypothetical protein ACREO4_16325 [Lysobacter sp.]